MLREQPRLVPVETVPPNPSDVCVEWNGPGANTYPRAATSRGKRECTSTNVGHNVTLR